MSTQGINGPFNPNNPNAVGRTTENASTRSVSGEPSDRGAATPVKNGDHATITPTASRLQQIAAAVEHTPDVDTKRVEAVKQAIANGDFEINSNRIADKMVAMDTALSRGGDR